MFFIVDLSIVIPVYNSEDTILPLILELECLLKGFSYEIICVDDCSVDGTRGVLKKLECSRPHVKCIYLLKNMGQQMATIRGISAASGAYVATIDDDFDQPPQFLLELYKKADSEGFDLVYGVPCSAGGAPLYRQVGSGLRNLFFSLIITKNPSIRVSSFRIMKRELASRICSSTHSYIYISAIAFEEKIKACTLYYQPKKRRKNSGYRLSSLVKIYWNLLWEYGLCKRK